MGGVSTSGVMRGPHSSSRHASLMCYIHLTTSPSSACVHSLPLGALCSLILFLFPYFPLLSPTDTTPSMTARSPRIWRASPSSSVAFGFLQSSPSLFQVSASSFATPPILSPPVLKKGLGISPVFLWWPHSMMFWKMPTLWR